MKKNILIMAICAIVAFSLTSCEEEEKTRTDLLTQKKGWELLTATSSPAYKNSDGEENENLFKVYFEECELDDILVFNLDKSSFMKQGKNVCEGDGKDISLGNWRFSPNEEVLEFHLPYFEDARGNFALLEARILVLNDKTLQIRMPIKFTDDPEVKGGIMNKRGMKGTKVDPEYQWTFTYKIP